MCGIAGFVTRKLPDEHLIEKLSAALAHRGPDGFGHVGAAGTDNAWHCRLGHRRLAIIDLATGDQPMSTPDGKVHLVFNGEIYNFKALRRELEGLGHVFRTHSDTEVVLVSYLAWGDQCVSRLSGMFAFAIWDGRDDSLFLARDRFGKKPLFLWTAPDGGLVFASEINALLVHPDVPRDLNQDSVELLLQWRYVPGPRTLFQGIGKLPPGSRLRWHNAQARIERYWAPPDGITPPPARTAVEKPVEAFLALLESAVADRMVSDVPFGAFLSGGLDSSTIVALMRRHLAADAVKTFSVGFDRPGYSELDYAGEVARHLGTDHTELTVGSAHIPELLPQLTRHRGAPVTEPADIAVYLLAKEASKTVKMVLSGEGADELLAGYPKHWGESWSALYRSAVPGWLHKGALQPIVRALPYQFRRAKILIDRWGVRDEQARFPYWFGGAGPIEAARLLAWPPRAEPPRNMVAPPEQTDPLRRILYFDQTSWLPDNLLERGDCMTMAASIEGRMPFMDERLYRFMADLPNSWRLRGTTGKVILRQAMQQVLPQSILTRPKVGFRVPVNEWLIGDLRGWMEDLLLGKDSTSPAWCNQTELRRLVGEHVARRQNHERILWMLLTLEVFFREFGLKLPQLP